MQSRYFEPARPRLFAHRGQSAKHPENTLPAFTAAAERVDYFELDVWSSADGVFVVHHDETLERTCGVAGRVADLDWSALSGLDAGHGFTDAAGTHPHRNQGIGLLRLDDLLERFPDKFVNIEIKHDRPGIARDLGTLLDGAGASDRCLVATASDAIRPQIIDSLPGYPTSMCYGEIEAFVGWLGGGCAGAFVPSANALQIPPAYAGIDLASAALIGAAHTLGLEVHYWTINDPAEIQRLLALGADGVMSDDPDLFAHLPAAST